MERQSSKTIWQKVIHFVNHRKQVLTAIHFFYAVLEVLIFVPLLGIIAELILKMSGKDVLSDLQIVGFIFSPLGFVSAVIFFALIITIIIFNQASMQAVAVAKLKQEHITALSSISFALKNAKTIFLFSNRLILRLLLLMLPFLALAALLGYLLITEHDINFYLTQQPPEFLTVAAVNTVLLFIMAVVLVKKLLRWSLALPLLLFNGVSPAQSFAKSQTMTVGQSQELFFYFAKWAFISLLVTIVLLGSINFVGNNLAALYFDALTILLFILGLFAVLLAMANFFITIFTSAAFASLTVQLANNYGASLNLEGLRSTELSSTWKLNRTKLLMLFVLLLLASLISSALFLQNFNELKSSEQKDIEIMAHRGASGKAPENTIAAVKQAIKDGADWVEIDVQETKDGAVIVIHDSDLMKLANVNTKIWEGTLKELQQSDVGSWFDPKFAGEKIPTLKQVLQEAKGKAKVLIELKYYGHDIALAQKVVDIVEELDMSKEIALMSLEPSQLKKIKTLRPDWDIGILFSMLVGDMAKMDVNFLAVNMAMIHPGFIRETHAIGKKLYVWTVDDPLSMFKMLSLNVDGIITNEPEIAKKVIQEQKHLQPIERFILHTAIMLGKKLPEKTYRDNSP